MPGSGWRVAAADHEHGLCTVGVVLVVILSLLLLGGGGGLWWGFGAG